MKEKQVRRICCVSKDLPPRASLVNRGMNTCKFGVLGPFLLIPFLSLKLFVLGRENAFWCFDFKCWRFFFLSGSWLVLERLFLWMMVLGCVFCLKEANIGGGLKS